MTRPTRLWTRLALTLAAPLVLAACITPELKAEDAEQPPITPTERYAIEVQTAPEELKLAPHPAGVSPSQAEALAVFARRWSDQEGGDVTVQTPAHAADPGAAYHTAVGAREALIEQGMTPAKVRIVSYDGAGDPRAPIVINYLRYVAKGPTCGQDWGNLTNTVLNRDTPNFGCATTANMAAQIANPADVTSPRSVEPADAARRQTVLDHYRKGEATSSAKDAQADGAISRAIP